MKIKCENVVRCGNYNCCHNSETFCVKAVVALDEAGKCVFYKSKNVSKTNANPDPLKGSNAC